MFRPAASALAPPTPGARSLIPIAAPSWSTRRPCSTRAASAIPNTRKSARRGRRCCAAERRTDPRSVPSAGSSDRSRRMDSALKSTSSCRSGSSPSSLPRPDMDITRSSHDTRKHYDATRALQGRLVTDDDLNVADVITKEDRRLERVDVIGPAGSPDDGFLIANPVTDGKGHIDFDITPGTFYLGGLRLVLAATEKFSAQGDWLQQRDADRASSGKTKDIFDLVYVEAWQQPVTAVEDGELREEALGGPDTSARLRTMRRVRVLTDVGTPDCDAAMQKLLQQMQIGALDPDRGRTSNARLKVGFTAGQTQDDLCSPSAQPGFLGAENQALRVELMDGAHLLWAYDNGAPLYRVNVNKVDQSNNQTELALLTVPADTDHWPVQGQTVELLAWSAKLANGEPIAEIRGPLALADKSPVTVLAKVATSCYSAPGVLRLATALPNGF